MWGIQNLHRELRNRCRFIPTHVGHTLAYCFIGRGCSGSSPRMWGILLLRFSQCCLSLGSSPRMWGIHALITHAIVYYRFIPTHVGHTHHLLPPAPLYAVHPHACGAYERAKEVAIDKYGSSPRMWGIRPAAGIIIHSNAVHPHACGAYDRVRQPGPHERGSSPRMWGIQLPILQRMILWRFIPTHVGHTLEEMAE